MAWAGMDAAAGRGDERTFQVQPGDARHAARERGARGGKRGGKLGAGCR